MDPPGTRYIERDGHALAYQVVGEGDADVVWFVEMNMHLDLMWTDPRIHYLLQRGTTFARTVYFQRRGFGLSDPVDHVPTLEQQADDVLAMMDEVGMPRATLIGIASTCGALTLLAARSPERVTGLVFVQPWAERLVGDDAEPHGWTVGERRQYVADWRDAYDEWGSGVSLHMWNPTEDSPYNRRLAGMLERCSATPATAREQLEWNFGLDYADVLPAVQCPTRVLLIPGSRVPVAAAQHVAEQIPNGTFHLLPPPPAGVLLGESWVPVLDHVEEVATGAHRPADADRFLAAVLFTDIVGSTGMLARIGDGPYDALRAAHERQVHDIVECNGGRLVNVAGDGTFSVFDGPAAATRCARRICADAHAQGIEVRAGVHAGEVQRAGPELTGMTVHIGARIGAEAGGGEVLVSRAARDLSVGSGLAFVDRGERKLKGVPGRWRLYALADADHTPRTLSRKAPRLSLIDQALLRTARRAPQVLRAAVSMAYARQRWSSRQGRSGD